MSVDVKAPMAGKIIEVRVKVGDQVQEDDELFILEAMKMEMPIVAPEAGAVKEVRVEPGQAVEADQVLAVLA
ncbi:MAG: biotin/lipoyl-containing protein [Thermodesulfobacteriota bacterium]